ncbi:MAG TPA: LPS assembly protein LptD [Candidatus Mailhella merdigallinarum]|uniref:LPS assembly protein LptD n=1 Tax=Candidatus Mailhella merdigallinarum TaxID=2838658 RepID=A0A9D2KJN6_9BACT|nr:LPS assembly protein LptD [Candidatus Mailhella merdigallinarum]
MPVSLSSLCRAPRPLVRLLCLWGCLFGGVGPLASVPAAAAAVDAAAPPVVENVATEPGSVETQGELPWRITADKMVSLNDGVIVEASGNVVLERGDDTLQADFARYFTTTDWVFVRGNVIVRMGRDELKAGEAEFDLNSGTGWLKNGTVFMAGPHIYFAGENVIKHWGDRYTFENAKVTACDGPVPAWSVAAQEAVVEIDGYATLSHSTFQVMDKGVIYAPYMVLPAKTTRQSGLLKPDYGYSSLHGAYATIPWFWAIDKSRDLTMYATWLERTGLMPAVEYRSHATDRDKTWLALDFLIDSTAIHEDYQDPVDASDGKIRTNKNRYWLRGMSQGQIGHSPWYYKYDLDYVSDQNFLREFQQRLTGFDATRASLADFFGRDLQELDKNRVTEGYVYRDWERFRLSFGARYEEDPSLGHGNASHDTDTLVQQIPGLNAYLYKGQMLPGLPLEVEAELNSAYMYRAKGTHGLRTELYPRVSLPLDIKYATLLATGGLRQTFYSNGPIKGGRLPNDQLPRWERGGGERRTIPDFDLTAFTQASRVWNLSHDVPLQATPDNAGRSRWAAVRHMLQPRLQYSWIPNVDQTHNPYYLEEDRLLPTNRMTFTLDNIFTVRRETVVADPAPEGQKPASATLTPSYFDVARLRLGTGYDLGEAGRKRHLELYSRRPMLDLMADMSVAPAPWIGFSGKVYISPYTGDVTRSDQTVTLSNARWGSWSVGHSSRNWQYDYARKVQRDSLWDIQFENSLSLLTNTVNLHLFPRWNVGYYSSTNLRDGETYERRVSLMYSHQCFNLVGQYVDKGRERSYRFSIELLGIND